MRILQNHTDARIAMLSNTIANDITTAIGAKYKYCNDAWAALDSFKISFSSLG